MHLQAQIMAPLDPVDTKQAAAWLEMHPIMCSFQNSAFLQPESYSILHDIHSVEVFIKIKTYICTTVYIYLYYSPVYANEENVGKLQTQHADITAGKQWATGNKNCGKWTSDREKRSLPFLSWTTNKIGTSKRFIFEKCNEIHVNTLMKTLQISESEKQHI